jgi:hypothetical protein
VEFGGYFDFYISICEINTNLGSFVNMHLVTPFQNGLEPSGIIFSRPERFIEPNLLIIKDLSTVIISLVLTSLGFINSKSTSILNIGRLKKSFLMMDVILATMNELLLIAF